MAVACVESRFPGVDGYAVVVLESVFFGGIYTLEYVGVLVIGFTTWSQIVQIRSKGRVRERERERGRAREGNKGNLGEGNMVVLCTVLATFL